MNLRKPKVLVIGGYGINCEEETTYAFELAGCESEIVHVNDLIEDRNSLSKFQVCVFPGGFSYGDDIAAGKILANELRYKLGDGLRKFVKDGKPVIGICNGFQVLIKTGLLDDINGEDAFSQSSTLCFNDSGKFECRWVHLKVNSKSRSIFLQNMPDVIYLPVAHAEGKFVPGDKTEIDRINSKQCIAFRYVDEDGNNAVYPDNPNGAVMGIAGITNEQGNVLGMMPHPERHVLKVHHPHWTRYDRKNGDGLQIFKNAVDYVSGKDR